MTTSTSTIVNCCFSIGGDILKKYLPKICKVAKPVELAMQLRASDLVTAGTEKKVNEVTGMTVFQKNAEIMNEVETIVKLDETGTKFRALCQVLQELDIELLKEYGVKMLKEAGLSSTVADHDSPRMTSE